MKTSQLFSMILQGCSFPNNALPVLCPTKCEDNEDVTDNTANHVTTNIITDISMAS